jgi:geranylgeranyl transferase type-2 subunit alpha
MLAIVRFPPPPLGRALPPLSDLQGIDGGVVHGWEYRRYVVENLERTRGTSCSKSEFEYTTTKTNNISNFSAWHNRANLIPTLLTPQTDFNFEQERKTFLAKGILHPDMASSLFEPSFA